MINRGDRVRIKASRQLIAMRLSQLNNRMGVITDVMLGNRCPGAMVKLDDSYDDSRYWYIPIASLAPEKYKGNAAKRRLLNEKVF